MKLKNYFQPSNFLLYAFLLIAVFEFAKLAPSYFDASFSINVLVNHVGSQSFAKQLILKNQVVHSILVYNSRNLLDYIFVDKTANNSLVAILFVIFVFIQLLRINALWVQQKFTSRLYTSIDTLSFVGALVFVFAGVRQYYLNNLIATLLVIP